MSSSVLFESIPRMRYASSTLRERIRYVMKETKFPKALIHMRQADLFLRSSSVLFERTFAMRQGIDSLSD
jgi:hypothetical protein